MITIVPLYSGNAYHECPDCGCLQGIYNSETEGLICKECKRELLAPKSKKDVIKMASKRARTFEKLIIKKSND